MGTLVRLDRSVMFALGALLLFVVAVAVGPARAQEHIGATVDSLNIVSRELDGASGPLKAGDDVFRNEIVRTGGDSRAKLVFLDSTNLAIGPTSRVTLDQFVYSTEVSAQKVTVNLAKGVFRFSTGALDKKAYEIETPTASIGVRGTQLDIGVAAARTDVTLIEGQAIVCARNGERCVVLSQTGQTAKATRTASGRIQTGFASTPVNIGSLCAGALCSTVAYASINPAGGVGGAGVAALGGGFPPGALCGR